MTDKNHAIIAECVTPLNDGVLLGAFKTGCRGKYGMTALPFCNAVPIAPWPQLFYIWGMEPAFQISDSAAARIAYLLKTEPPGTRLRVAVEGGGCSGFQYKFDFVTDSPASDDKQFGTEAAPVLVDETSLEFLKDAMLDYIERLDSAAFEIVNPNAKSGCGCGNSFSVAL